MGTRLFCSANQRQAVLRSVCTKSDVAASDRPERDDPRLRSVGHMSEVDSEWLGRTGAAVRRMLGDVIEEDRREMALRLDEFAGAIEPAPDQVHRAALATALIDVCCRIVTRCTRGFRRAAADATP